MNNLFNINDINYNKLSELDKHNLLLYLQNNYIEMRPIINVSNKYTFGFEVEYTAALYDKVNNLLKESYKNKILKKQWSYSNEETCNEVVADILYGGESISPILIDREEDWKDLIKVCKLLIKNKAKVNEKCGGHIHIGIQIFENNKQYLINFLKLWTIYEDIIYRFSFGINNMPRYNMFEFALPFREYYYTHENKINEIATNDKKNYYDLIYYLHNSSNFNCLNFKHLIDEKAFNTIEVRCPNATLDPVIWQNNVNLFIKLIEYAKSSNFNKDLINKKIKEVDYYDYRKYNMINFDKALELSNLLFEDKIDKLNFLKQYLKQYNIIDNTIVPKQEKKFTK